MGWAAPKTWASGDVLLASEMNIYVRDNLRYLLLSDGGLKLLLSVEETFSQTITIGSSPITLQLLNITDPAFPTDSWAFVAFGAFIASCNDGGATPPSDVQLFIRANSATGELIGRSLHRSTTNNSRQSLSIVAKPYAVAFGDRGCYFNASANQADTFDINYAGLTTKQGALLVPV